MITTLARARGRFHALISSFGITEKILFYGCILVATVSILSYTYTLNSRTLVQVPRSGGSFTEGFVGSPRSINPVIAVSDTDRDLVSLVYTGLMRAGKDGEFLPSLASKYGVSEDGLVYTFTIRDDAVFHDNTKVTTADIAYTISLIQDPAIKSPRRAQWEGVVTEIISEKEIRFILKQPYGSFIVNTTVGIIPKHLWEGVSPEEFPFSNLNLNPIGAGPYKISNTKLSSSGLIEEMTLKSWNKFSLGKPYIKKIKAVFFSNENSRIEAVLAGDIDTAAGLSKEGASELKNNNFNLVESPLHRLFGIFFNQNLSPVLIHREIRTALNEQVNREALVEEVLGGFGTTIDSPIPEFSNLFASIKEQGGSNEPKTEDILETLAKAGWKKNEDGVLQKGKEKLIFSIYTSDNPELKLTATRVSELWNQIGAIVDVKIFEPAQLNLGIIRPRKYDALLFGVTIGRDLDYYAFWHSSQRNDPGLNIALYTNPKADKLLASARTETDPSKRKAAEEAFALEVLNDIPAVFLYSPHFIYALPSYIQGYDRTSLRAPGDRFYDVYSWYIETDNVWSVFTK